MGAVIGGKAGATTTLTETVTRGGKSDEDNAILRNLQCQDLLTCTFRKVSAPCFYGIHNFNKRKPLRSSYLRNRTWIYPDEELLK